MRFWNIGKANAEIERLEAENSTLKQQLTEAANSTPEAVKSAEEEIGRLNADLTTAKASIASLTAAVETAKAKDTQIADLMAKLTAKDAEVAKQVAAKLAETQAAIGVPPVPAAPQTASSPAPPKSGYARVLAAAKNDLQAGGYVPKR